MTPEPNRPDEREAAEAVERMRRAGTILSNLAFNLAQDHAMSDQWRRSLNDARREWDTAHAQHRLSEQLTRRDAPREGGEACKTKPASYEDFVRLATNPELRANAAHRPQPAGSDWEPTPPKNDCQREAVRFYAQNPTAAEQDFRQRFAASPPADAPEPTQADVDAFKARVQQSRDKLDATKPKPSDAPERDAPRGDWADANFREHVAKLRANHAPERDAVGALVGKVRAFLELWNMNCDALDADGMVARMNSMMDAADEMEAAAARCGMRRWHR